MSKKLRVSVITPTYNRRQFIPNCRRCFLNQTYPQDKMEWLICDDGDDSVKDLVDDLPNVKYFRPDKKMDLGKKRNFLNKKASGDIIICFDDDDYYPECRVEHAVDELIKSNVLIAGSSKLYVYFPDDDTIYQYGPYGKYHGCNASYAYKREYLKKNSYDETRTQGEEPSFTNNFSNKMIQLDSKKTMLAIVHNSNTVLKRKEAKADFALEDIVTDPYLVEYYRGLRMTIPKEMLDYYTVPTEYDENSFVIFCGPERKERPELGFQDIDYKISYDREFPDPEEYLKELALFLRRAGKRVFIYGHVKSCMYEGIYMYHFGRFPRDKEIKIHNLIAWNTLGIGFLGYAENNLKVQIENVYIDLYTPEQISIPPAVASKVRATLTKTQTQADLVPSVLSPAHTPQGINIRNLKETRKRKSFCVVTPHIDEYRAFIIDIFSKLRYNDKKITLSIYSDYDKVKADKELFDLTKRKYITLHRYFDRDDMLKQFQESSFVIFLGEPTKQHVRHTAYDIREASAYGCIPILGKTGVYGECKGIHVNRSNTDETVQVLGKLLKDSTLCENLRQELQNDDYSWESAYKIWEKVLIEN